jgi:hypothetical protein
MQHAQHVSFGRFDTTARTAAGPAGTCTRQRTRPFSLAGQRQSRQRGQRQRQREKQQSRSSSGHHGIALASRRRQHTGRGAALTRRRFASSVACSKQLHGWRGGFRFIGGEVRQKVKKSPDCTGLIPEIRSDAKLSDNFRAFRCMV